MAGKDVTMMNLTDYAWEIFDIARANDKDIGVGRDMFIANMEQKREAYQGASHLNYVALGQAWQNLGLEGQTKQRNLYNQIFGAKGRYYHKLCEIRAKGDKTGFDALVAKAVAE